MFVYQSFQLISPPAFPLPNPAPNLPGRSLYSSGTDSARPHIHRWLHGLARARRRGGSTTRRASLGLRFANHKEWMDAHNCRSGSLGSVVRLSASATGTAATTSTGTDVNPEHVMPGPDHRAEARNAMRFLRPSFNGLSTVPSRMVFHVQPRFVRFLASRSRFPVRFVMAFSGLPHRPTSFGIHS